jgi:hypothetical protein
LAPVATDNCGAVTYEKTSGAFAAGSCGSTGTYTNTWVAKDACLNTSSVFTQLITITDVTAPVWSTVATTLNASVECSDAAGLITAQAMAPIATDNCGSVTYVKTSGAFAAGSCGATGTYTNTWVAKDACLNTSTVFTQLITITDVTAPTWTTVAGALNTTVECSNASGIANAQTLAPVATDNCGAVTYEKTSGAFAAGSCGSTGTYTNTWVAKDACLNTSSVFIQLITITDETHPVITCPAPVVTVTNDGSNATGVILGVPVVSDNCTPTASLLVTNNHPSTTYPLGITTVTWTVTDACGNSTTCEQTVTVTGLSVTGTFKYYNLNGDGTPASTLTPLSGVTVELWQDGVKKYPVTGSVTTTSGGAYAFDNVVSGTYSVFANCSKPTTGAINATDAAQVNFWGVSPYLIEKIRFYTGDGVMDNFVDASDASRILKNFTTSGSWGWVNRGNWTFWLKGETINDNDLASPVPLTQIDLPTITVLSSALSKDFYGMVTGDFNGSLVPAAKSANQALTLEYDQLTTVKTGDVFELPVKAGMAMEVGAASLIMNFPSDKLEILGVYLGNDATSPVEYGVNGDEIRIGWMSVNPLSLKADDKLITLKVRSTVSVGKDETIRFMLNPDPLNELADGSYRAIEGAVLKMAEIGGTALGTGEITMASRLTLLNYPNPFIGTTTFAYSLPVDGKVKLEISDMLGSKVKILVDEIQTAGDHTLTVDANELKPGVYTATLRLISSDAVLIRTIKIVRNQ